MLKIAFRNLLRQKSRYAVIFLAIVFGFSVIVFIFGVSSGFERSLQQKAARYFSGEISITGYFKNDFAHIPDQKAILDMINQSGIPVDGVCRRVIYDSLDAAVFFNGESVRQRKLIGVDWGLERPLFSRMDFIAGGLEGMGQGNGILVSEQVAARTGIRVGDECLVLLTTRMGARNTASLVVSGIFAESSFFGAASYLDIDTLNRVWGMAPGMATEMGLILRSGVSQEWAAQRLWAILGGSFAVFPLIETRAQQTEAIDTKWEGCKYAVMTLDAHLSTITDILGALHVVTWFVLGLFVLIVVIGIGNTYRMIIRERTKEIGTMRSLGMQKSQLLGVFLAESTLLGMLGMLSGLVLGVVLLAIAGAMDFSWMALAGVFLERGHLVWYLSPGLVSLAGLVLVLSAQLGAWGPARAASRLDPVQALSQEK